MKGNSCFEFQRRYKFYGRVSMRIIIIRTFPKKFFVVGFIEHLGVFYATTIELLVSATRPRHLTYRVSGRQPVEPSTREMQWGLALHNSKAPAVPEVLTGCVVA
jgi:hypothetical protein